MELIFFEKQEGQLCAQHALNALLQGAYFMATDLADIARRLDNEERGVYGDGGGYDSPEYLQQFQVDSHNMDDSGFFSVQVISEALKIWNLELIPYLSRNDENALEAQRDPLSQTAYICNYRQHWFTVRKLGSQWFNLNSMLNKPELVSDTYLQLFLGQLQNDGYSIFLVKGVLPACVAEDALTLCPAPMVPSPSSARRREDSDETDDELAQAIKMSMEQSGKQQASVSVKDDDEIHDALKHSRKEHDADDVSLQQVLTKSLVEQEDEELLAALRMSMEEVSAGASATLPTATESSSAASSRPAEQATKTEALTREELRQKRLAHLEKQKNDANPGGSTRL